MSKAINNPKLADVKSNGKNSAVFTIEPLHPGYGNTLGNSLRRVLLGSIEGSAVVAFRVAGATHEFTTLPGIKEDVVEIMINLKNISIKSHSEGAIDLTLSKKGAGVVLAGDIKTTADVEIVNPEAVICTIDDPKAKIDMDLVVDSGRGYLTIEESSVGRKHGDMIAIDAMFSPVRRVRYNVDSTRVGQKTDLDRLILTIDTDGSISPKEAFEEAAAILVNQYQALAGSTTVKAVEIEEISAPNANKSVVDLPIEELEFSARTVNALTNGGVSTIGDLVTIYNSGELENLKGFGKTAFEEVSQRIAELEF
jgi:DNA-directed RNA polymerase subunit alpha